MLCARPRLAPHAPAPPCAVPKALTSVGRAPFAGRASSRWPRSSPRRRGRLARRCEAGPGRCSLPLSRRRERECCSPCTPLPLAAQVDAEEWAQVPEDQPIADISLVDTVRAASTPTPTRRLPCTGHVLATTPASPPVCAVGREQAGVDEVPADADQARGEPPARPRPPDLGRPARGVHRLQPYTQAATLCMQAATLREPRLRSRALYNVETAACRLQPYAPTLQPYAPQLPNFHSLCRTDYSSGRSASPSGPSGSSPTAGTRPSATSCWYAPLYA